MGFLRPVRCNSEANILRGTIHVKPILLVLIYTLSFSATVRAQAFEAGGFGGALRLGNSGDIGSLSVQNPNDPAQRTRLQDKWLFGLRMTLNSWDHFGHEMTYAYHRTAIQTGTAAAGQGTAIHTVTYGMLAYATPEGSRVRPFAQGGGGFSNFIPPGGSISQTGGDRKFGFFYGGGIKFQVMEDGPWWLRFDFRQHQTGKPFNLAGQDGLLKRNEISVGVSYGL
jgi:Outer membrane protein beta-barrel domain